MPLAAATLRSADAAVLVEVHKTPECGCCALWAEHLADSGFAVDVDEAAGLNALKARLGVPDALASCHTATVADYVVEGHVPAEAIRRLLALRPNITGLAVPGMPAGSPGMPAEAAEPYDVIAFGPAGTEVFMSFVGERAA